MSEVMELMKAKEIDCIQIWLCQQLKELLPSIKTKHASYHKEDATFRIIFDYSTRFYSIDIPYLDLPDDHKDSLPIDIRVTLEIVNTYPLQFIAHISYTNYYRSMEYSYAYWNASYMLNDIVAMLVFYKLHDGKDGLVPRYEHQKYIKMPSRRYP